VTNASGLTTVCVFCGSQAGALEEYRTAAADLARAMHARNIGLVYGGGSTGLMGEIASTLIELGGHVTGVIPHALKDRELAHSGLQRLEVVDDMHERKALMTKLSDAFVAMPGGFGTLEELFEVITWNQLEFHNKPIGLLNVAGFYDQLVDFIQYQSSQGFISIQHKDILVAESSADALIDNLNAAR